MTCALNNLYVHLSHKCFGAQCPPHLSFCVDCAGDCYDAWVEFRVFVARIRGSSHFPDCNPFSARKNSLFFRINRALLYLFSLLCQLSRVYQTMETSRQESRAAVHAPSQSLPLTLFVPIHTFPCYILNWHKVELGCDCLWWCDGG